MEIVCVWKTNIETKGLCVNVGKKNIITSVKNAPKPVEASKFPCGVCNKGVGSNLNALFVDLSCTNAAQTSRVIFSLTLR